MPSGLWGWNLAPGSNRLVLGHSGFFPLSLGVRLRLPLRSRRPGGYWSCHSYGRHFDVHSGLMDQGERGASHRQRGGCTSCRRLEGRSIPPSHLVKD
jgi:hypothetical protein